MPRPPNGMLFAGLAGLLLAAYVGAYAVMVRPVRLISYTAETLPSYSLDAGTILTVQSTGWLSWHTLFAPIHAVDRRLRPSTWNLSLHP